MGRAFRLVCSPPDTGAVEDLLRSQGYAFDPEPFSPWARGLSSEPSPLGSSLAAYFGYLYIQDRSSMLPPLALDPPSGGRVLDMCASPGGKSSFLAQLVGPEGFVLANEPGREREANLRRNLLQMNLPQVGSCSYPGESLPLPDGSWEHILLDPPCSGWGTAERNPKVLSLWRESKVEPLIVLQRRLMAEAARLLAPGGRLLYSTCTTNPAENEDQVSLALDRLGLELSPLEPFPGFSHAESLPGCLRVEQVAGEAQGFFLALLRKPGRGGPNLPEPGPAPGREVAVDDLLGAGCDTAGLPRGDIRCFGDNVFFLPGQSLQALPSGFVWRGLPLGRLHKGGFRPHPRLRLLLPPAAAGPCLDTDSPEQVQALLTGQSLDLPGAEEPCGLYFRSLPLGRLRLKGRRALWTDR